MNIIQGIWEKHFGRVPYCTGSQISVRQNHLLIQEPHFKNQYLFGYDIGLPNL